MNYIKQLKQLIKNDILIEVNETIKEIQSEFTKKKNKKLKEELQYIQQVKQYFNEVLIDIENNTITQEEALDILEGLEDMKIENQEV